MAMKHPQYGAATVSESAKEALARKTAINYLCEHGHDSKACSTISMETE